MKNNEQGITTDYEGILAKAALDLGAIRLSPQKPFLWASGYWMPIYNDNRLLLSDAKVRLLIAQGFEQLLHDLAIEVDAISGTATAGIPHATTLADLMGKPLSYVRSSGKAHGLKNLIEGLGPDGSYQGAKVLLIEDLISTGGSSIKAIKAIREADGVVEHCFSIFTYGLAASAQAFDALDPPCTLNSLLRFDVALDAALNSGYVDSQGVAMLKKWKEDPFGWGAAHGFAPKE